mmetsp:Transcript_19206/g.31990  ORF Transcript_19206/g.31990 Transcript_19206/m.31990 type:complete len:208 (+) Transcript_19206:1710-2333(+)
MHALGLFTRIIAPYTSLTIAARTTISVVSIKRLAITEITFGKSNIVTTVYVFYFTLLISPESSWVAMDKLAKKRELSLLCHSNENIRQIGQMLKENKKVPALMWVQFDQWNAKLARNSQAHTGSPGPGSYAIEKGKRHIKGAHIYKKLDHPPHKLYVFDADYGIDTRPYAYQYSSMGEQVESRHKTLSKFNSARGRRLRKRGNITHP